MKIVFMGTPEFAVPSLRLLYHADPIEVIAVVTQPDRPAGRGNKLQPSPVKTFALDNNIPVFQPEKIRKDPETLAFLAKANADAFVTVAFGQILSKEILDMPRLGTINLHASLLPKYRGANPIQWAIINGETHTGITTMLTEEGVDCGDILLQQEIPILIDDNAEIIAKKISFIGSRALTDSLLALDQGLIKPRKQEHSKASKAPKLKKSIGQINWGLSTWKIHNLIRGTKPWPGTYTYYKDKMIKIHSSYIPSLAEGKVGCDPGSIREINDQTVQVYTGDGYIDILEVQPSNKPRMKAIDWANGARLKAGNKLSNEP